jgi:hypothetical protein
MKGITVGKGKITHILYADDNVLLPEMEDDLQVNLIYIIY